MSAGHPVLATGSDRLGWSVAVRDGSGPMGAGRRDPARFYTRADVLAVYPTAVFVETAPRQHRPQSGMRTR